MLIVFPQNIPRRTRVLNEKKKKSLGVLKGGEEHTRVASLLLFLLFPFIDA